MPSNNSPTCSSSGPETVTLEATYIHTYRLTDLHAYAISIMYIILIHTVHTYIHTACIHIKYIHTYILHIYIQNNYSYLNYIFQSLLSYIYLHTYMVIVETLKDTLTLEAMKLTDSENRLKQTELHLQGEMNRVTTVINYIHTYIHTYCIFKFFLINFSVFLYSSRLKIRN